MQPRYLLIAATLCTISPALQAQAYAIPQPSPGLLPNAATGKKLFDKRETLKRKVVDREVEKALKFRR